MDYFLMALVPVLGLGALAGMHFWKVLNEAQSAKQKKMQMKRSRFSDVNTPVVDVHAKPRVMGFGRR